MRIVYALITTLMIAILTHLNIAHAAVKATPSCQMTSEGIYNGLWVKHRIVAEENVIGGADDMASIINQLEALRSEGLCR